MRRAQATGPGDGPKRRERLRPETTKTNEVHALTVRTAGATLCLSAVHTATEKARVSGQSDTDKGTGTMSTRQNVVHVKECACYLQGHQPIQDTWRGRPRNYTEVIVAPCHEFDNRDHSGGRNIPTDAQIADAVAILAQARAASARRVVANLAQARAARRAIRCPKGAMPTKVRAAL